MVPPGEQGRDLSLRVRVGRPERLQLPEETHEVQEIVLEAVELRELEKEREAVGILLQGLLELADAGVVEGLLALPGAQRRRAQKRLRGGVVRRRGDGLVGRPERFLRTRVPVFQQPLGGCRGFPREPLVALGDEGRWVLDERPEEKAGPRDTFPLKKRLQGVTRRRRACEAPSPILGVQHPEECVDRGGNRRIEERGQIRLDLGHAAEGRGDRVGREGVVAAEELVEDRSHREQVCAWVQLLATRLLRRHVSGGADDGAREREARQVRRVADAEVADLHAAVARPHDVLRLDVAVDDAFRMGDREAGEGLPGDVKGDLPGEPAGLPPKRVQLAAVDELHDDVGLPGGRAAVQELDDVRVLEGDLDPDLMEEAVEEVGIRRDVGQDLLERHRSAGFLVHGLEDLGHAPERDSSHHPVMVDALGYPRRIRLGRHCFWNLTRQEE